MSKYLAIAANLDANLGDEVNFKERVALIESAILQAVAEERERCALICDEASDSLAIEAKSHFDRDWMRTGHELRQRAIQAKDDATAIRSGGAAKN